MRWLSRQPPPIPAAAAPAATAAPLVTTPAPTFTPTPTAPVESGVCYLQWSGGGECDAIPRSDARRLCACAQPSPEELADQRTARHARAARLSRARSTLRRTRAGTGVTQLRWRRNQPWRVGDRAEASTVTTARRSGASSDLTQAQAGTKSAQSDSGGIKRFDNRH